MTVGSVQDDIEKDEGTGPELGVEETIGNDSRCVEQTKIGSSMFSKFHYMLISGSAKQSDDYNVPEISVLQLFLKFLWFGCRAFGGALSKLIPNRYAHFSAHILYRNPRSRCTYCTYEARISTRREVG
jgi:hypothetical protein